MNDRKRVMANTNIILKILVGMWDLFGRNWLINRESLYSCGTQFAIAMALCPLNSRMISCIEVCYKFCQLLLYNNHTSQRHHFCVTKPTQYTDYKYYLNNDKMITLSFIYHLKQELQKIKVSLN